MRIDVRPLGHPIGSIRIESEADAPPEALRSLLERLAPTVVPSEGPAAEWARRYVAGHLDRLAFDLALAQRYLPAGAEVVDVGALPPLFGAGLRELGFEVRGLDIDPSRFADVIERLELDVLRCDVEREPIPIESDSVDAVVLHEVFEHMRIDLVRTLSEIARILRPGGRLLVSTPNLTSLGGLRNLLLRGVAYSAAESVYSEYEKLRTIGHMGHVREYSPGEVLDLLARVRLEPEVVVYRGRYGRVGRAITKLAPMLRPFFEVVARKPGPAR
jgi:SAM-dependent methyltransferase